MRRGNEEVRGGQVHDAGEAPASSLGVRAGTPSSLGPPAQRLPYEHRSLREVEKQRIRVAAAREGASAGCCAAWEGFAQGGASNHLGPLFGNIPNFAASANLTAHLTTGLCF